MGRLEEIPKTYEDAVLALARWHAEGHDQDMDVYSIPDPNKATVQLIEVSGVFPETGHLTPLAMGRSDDFPFKSCVALVTRSEWEYVQRGEIPMPEGWNLAEVEKVWPP